MNTIPYWKTLLWSLLMLVLFLLPADNFSNAPSVLYLSETIHVLMFFTFTWLLIRDLVKKRSVSRPEFKIYILAIVLAVLYGALIEFLQWVSALGRTAEFLDIVYDLAGGLIAAIFSMVFYGFRRV